MNLLLWTVLGCGPPDYDSWQDYLAAVQARFQQDGSCAGLTELPVSMLDGDAYWGDLRKMGAASLDAWGDVYSYDTGAGILLQWTSANSDVSRGCAAMEADDELTVALYHHLSEQHHDRAEVLADDMYAWTCIDSATDASGHEPGPASWSGLAFAHAETWTLPDGSTLPGGSTLPDDLGGGELPLDLLLDFADIDCADSENASRSESPESCFNWGSQCDGIDNDLDGEIDEGEGLDNDGNGVPDCQDDWDGDGIPNHEDDDVAECCCND